MNQSAAEAIILAINAMGAGILFFVAGVVQPLMNGMDAFEFKTFLNALDRTAMSNHVAVTVATLPLIAIVLYLGAYGFDHWWFIAGFIVWIVGSAVTKMSNMPIYRWVGDPLQTDAGELAKRRRQLGVANSLRAWLTLFSVILMACQFGPLEVGAVVVASTVIAVPLTWLSRRYTPTAEQCGGRGRSRSPNL
ncbi:hypothetical protein HFO91_08285 [Rhizobium leguminosarum]|jgi:hypothetical protein|uniref:hypothetical protein n=1 Tax=Rhizobium leguminosarum TaxID=384 RepID=UPI001C969EAA|nr:hypothetical protein [Rhizobium leguminosarum]MBY5367027.1 hypothetical protein [Rhizobium leguminosarum]MBY5449661.1 hypothetical protein [Rhizobium leguminosarum]